jgi:hypothetical protein
VASDPVLKKLRVELLSCHSQRLCMCPGIGICIDASASAPAVLNPISTVSIIVTLASHNYSETEGLTYNILAGEQAKASQASSCSYTERAGFKDNIDPGHGYS